MWQNRGSNSQYTLTHGDATCPGGASASSRFVTSPEAQHATVAALPDPRVHAAMEAVRVAGTAPGGARQPASQQLAGADAMTSVAAGSMVGYILPLMIVAVVAAFFVLARPRFGLRRPSSRRAPGSRTKGVRMHEMTDVTSEGLSDGTADS